MINNPHELLSPRSCPVGALLSKSIFQIPRNQREYRWGEDPKNNQCLKLWDDLVATVAHDGPSGTNQPMGHFLGQIVVIGPEDSSDFQRLEVVDGQQRLTTLTILCASLKPFVLSIDDRRVRERYQNLITNCIVSSAADAPRVKLNRDDEFYRNTLVECETQEERLRFWEENCEDSKEVQQNIRSAFVLFHQKISEYLALASNKEDADTRLETLVDILTKNLYFLVVRCENSWLVYRLFETLNERGLDLSQADLIKNVLLESSRSSGEDKVGYVFEKWEEFLTNYEMQPEKKLDLPHLIQFSYSYRNNQVKKEDIFDTISQQIRAGRIEADKLVSEFVDDSTSWNRFLLGDLTSWSEEQEDAQFAIIDPLWKKHCAPYVMAIMDKAADDIDLLLSYTRLCEDYLFRQGLICNEGATKLQKVFSEAAALVRVDRDIGDIEALFRSYSPDDLFVEEFKSASVNSMKQGFYTIWKIEAYLGKNLGDEFRPKSQSALQHLEHIMPRVPDEGWEHIVDRDEFPRYINRIGNFLVLESRNNQHIKNKSLSFKIQNANGQDYASSRLSLPREFVEKSGGWMVHEKWTFQSIALRQDYLANNYAVRVWPLKIS